MDKIDAFVCPSKFTLNKLKQSGFNGDKLYHIPTFVSSHIVSPKYCPGDYILYFGRLTPEKGVEVLLEAYKKIRLKKRELSTPLILASSFNQDEKESIREKIGLNKIEGVKILGVRDKYKLYELIKNSAFTIVPSICYENMPNSILESFACGKPVIGSRIGSIPELIKNETTGLLFESGITDSLVEEIVWLIRHPNECEEMGRRARELVENEYNQELHYQRIMQLFKNTLH
jgi:glycosyltransferase involved in cell wall biosynthesis